jgi:hypothetical protein
MAHKYLRYGVALAAALFLISPALGWASAIPSRGDAGRDVRKVQDLLAPNEVARVLVERGLGTEDVQHRLARLSDEDLRSLAANVDQIQAAGQVPHYIWILLGIFLAVSILVMIF